MNVQVKKQRRYQNTPTPQVWGLFWQYVKYLLLAWLATMMGLDLIPDMMASLPRVFSTSTMAVIAAAIVLQIRLVQRLYFLTAELRFRGLV